MGCPRLHLEEDSNNTKRVLANLFNIDQPEAPGLPTDIRKNIARHALDGSKSGEERIQGRLCLMTDDMSHSAQYCQGK